MLSDIRYAFIFQEPRRDSVRGTFSTKPHALESALSACSRSFGLGSVSYLNYTRATGRIQTQSDNDTMTRHRRRTRARRSPQSSSSIRSLAVQRTLETGEDERERAVECALC